MKTRLAFCSIVCLVATSCDTGVGSSDPFKHYPIINDCGEAVDLVISLGGVRVWHDTLRPGEEGELTSDDSEAMYHFVVDSEGHAAAEFESEASEITLEGDRCPV